MQHAIRKHDAYDLPGRRLAHNLGLLAPVCATLKYYGLVFVLLGIPGID